MPAARPTTPRTIRLAPLLGRGEACHVADVRPAALPTRAHRHDFVEFFWVTAGSGVERIGCGGAATDRPIAVGDFAFVRADDVHGFDAATGDAGAGSGLRFCNVAFAARRWASLVARYDGLLADRFAAGAERRGSLGVDGLRRLESSADPLRRGRRDGLALDRFLLDLDAVMADRDADATRAAVPAWLARAAADAATLVRGVGPFVDACGYSPEHVARCCRRHLGCTPTQLVTDARLDAAARALARPDASVTDAALAAGFNNLGHFHARFRERFGTTPRRYKARQHAVA